MTMIAFDRIKSFFATAVVALFTAAGIFGLAGCDSTGVSDGTLRLNLTDAPLDIIEEANVTIDQVSIISGSVESEQDTASSEEGEIFVLSDETMEFDLLELQDIDTLLVQEEIPAGSYSQIRLRVTEASMVLENGDVYTLGPGDGNFRIPSGQQTGIKILLPNFTVESDAETELTLDFDVEDSFVVQGNPDTPAGVNGFIFKPVVRPVNM